MDEIDHAKLFMPFDALDGFYATIRKKEELKDAFIYLDEDEKAKLNDIICTLEVGDDISVKYYKNGHYIVKKGKVHKIDIIKHAIFFKDETFIKFNMILSITQNNND
jgi:hypothetical protein